LSRARGQGGKGGGGAPERRPGRPADAGPAGGLRAALRTPPALAGIALVAISRVVFAWLIPTVNEDAFITFRYAGNLVSGLGAVYNPGERVLGYTSPLWMLWNAAGIATLRDPVLWSHLGAGLADLVSLVACVALLERHASRAAAWGFAVLFGAWPYFAAVSVSGMESSLMLALMALAGWQVATRGRGAGVTLGALALVRPEGLLAALAMVPWARGRERLTAGAIALAGFGALALYYGSPVPQSVLAKASVYGAPGPLHSRAWWDWIVPFDLGGWPALGDTAQLWTLRLVLGPGALAGLLALRRTPALPWALAGLAVWASYVVTGASYFFWYLLVPAATVAFLASVGLPGIVRGPWIPAAAGLLVLGAWTYQPAFYRGRAVVESQHFGEVAVHLDDHARPGQSVLLEPIGMVGWLGRALVLRDETGLVTPSIAERRARGAGWYADAVRLYRPDWLVVRADFLGDPRAFAGRGAPFRDSTEFRSTLSAYRATFTTTEPPSPNDLVVLRRLAGED
jgi:hypothetical protein